MPESALGPARAALVQVSAALAGRDAERVGNAMKVALARAEPAHVEEVILQSYLFLGYPAALNAFAAWREMSGRAGEGLGEDEATWPERGEAVCREVYGGQYDRLRANVRALHPDMERWMLVEGYGKVLGRPGLPLPDRELCIAALLAVLRAPAQLYSHLRGALNVGATEREISEALGLAAAAGDDEARRTAQETWRLVAASSPGAG